MDTTAENSYRNFIMFTRMFTEKAVQLDIVACMVFKNNYIFGLISCQSASASLVFSKHDDSVEIAFI